MKQLTLKEKQKLADFFHYEYCNFSHIDQCSYGYGDWKNDIRWIMKKELEKVEKLIKKHGIDFVINMKKIIEKKQSTDEIYENKE